MPTDYGDYEETIPDDIDSAEVTRMPSRWRRILNLLWGR